MEYSLKHVLNAWVLENCIYMDIKHQLTPYWYMCMALVKLGIIAKCNKMANYGNPTFDKTDTNSGYLR